MKSLPQRYVEDKALRDAAKSILDADLAHFLEGLAKQGIAGRMKAQITGKVQQRITVGARDVLEQAKAQASDHRGVLAVLVGALIIWLAREPLLGLFGLDDPDLTSLADDTTDETQGA